jgi:hypothetical protein
VTSLQKYTRLHGVTSQKKTDFVGTPARFELDGTLVLFPLHPSREILRWIGHRHRIMYRSAKSLSHFGNYISIDECRLVGCNAVWLL